MIRALLFIAGFATACTGVGYWVVAGLDRNRVLTELERALSAFSIGGGILYLAIFAVGPYRLDAVSMGGLAAAAMVIGLMGLRLISRDAVQTAFRDVVQRCRRDWFFAALSLVCVGIGLSSVLQGMAPPNDYDSLMYHLSIPQLDVERGWIAPAWDRGMPHVLFPALMHHLYRLALIVGGEGSVQMVHGLYGLVAAGAAARLARRLGFDINVGLLAATMFLAVRAVVWEMATPEVDVALATYMALALVVYLAARERTTLGNMVLVGLLLGGAMGVKLHGIVIAACFGTAILIDVARKRYHLLYAVAAGMSAVLVFTPHLVRTYILTANPLFPLFNNRVVPGGRAFFGDTHLVYGTGRDLLDVITAPWSFSIFPMQYFDGMILGAPYLLALAPLSIGAWGRFRTGLLAVVVVVATYYVAWFFFLSQQVRFLIPIFPAVSAFAAIGVSVLWASTRAVAVSRVAATILLSVLTLNQAMFVGIYTVLRLPPAVGLMSADRYHTDTPTLQGAFYRTCSYIREHLRDGEQYLSLLMPHSYYCPQLAAILQFFPDEARTWMTSDKFPEMSLSEFIRRFEQARFRFVIVPRSYENRRNDTGEPVDVALRPEDMRFGPLIVPAIRDVRPLSADRFTAVYDGPEVLEQLKAMLRRPVGASVVPQ